MQKSSFGDPRFGERRKPRSWEMPMTPTPTGAALERIKEILRSHYPRGVNPMLNEVHDLLDAALRAPSPAALERLTETLDPSAHALKARNQVWAQAVAIAHWGNSPTVAAALEAASKLPPSPPFGPRVLDQLYGGAPSPAALGEGEAELFDANVNRLKACEHIADGDEGWEKLRNECPSTAAVARLRDALTELREALTPSAETKAAYIGEFKMRLHRRDECGDEYHEDVTLSWTVIKEIMTAISNRAALSPSPGPRREGEGRWLSRFTT
jgi:hypothetical protein